MARPSPLPSLNARLGRVLIPGALLLLGVNVLVSRLWRGPLSGYAFEEFMHGVVTLALVGVLALQVFRSVGLRLAEIDNEHRNTDEERRVSEERLRFALAGSRDGLWDWDLTNNRVYYSHRWKAMLGYSADEVEPSLAAWERLVHPEDRERALRLVEEVRSGRRPHYEVEFRMRHKVGHWVEILSRGTLVGERDDGPHRLVGTHVDITSRKRAAEAMQEVRDELERRVEERTRDLQEAVAKRRATEERLLSQLSETPALLYSSKPDQPSSVVLVGDNIRSLLGFEPEEVMGDPGFWLRHVHPDDVEGVEKRVATVLQVGFRASEYRIRNKAGDHRWLRDYLRLIRDARGEPVELVGCAIDITERRQAEEQLRARENEVRTLVENSKDLIARFDREGCQTYANPAFAKLYGLSSAELTGKRLRELGLPPSVWQPARETFERVLATGHEESVELAHELDGRLRHFEARCVPEWVTDGPVASVMVIAREVTERRRAEEALRETEMRARAFAEAAFEGIVIHDGGKVLEVNQVALTLFGLASSAMVGKPLRTFIEWSAPALECEDAVVDEIQSCEAEGVKGDGSRFPIQLQSRDFPYCGRMVRVTAVRDMTVSREAQERIRALQTEEALKREKAERESFARQLITAQERERERIATELHDALGQNVLVIKRRAERGLADPARPERMQENLAAISALAAQSVAEIRNIVRDLHPHLLKQLGLTRALRAMLDSLGQSSSIQFTSEIQNVDGILRPESELALYRVVQECLSNVVKHSRATEAQLKMRREAGQLYASIRDNGQGFDREHASRGDGQGGLGLRSITERMAMLGGSARIHTQPGHGTRVEIELPFIFGGLFQGLCPSSKKFTHTCGTHDDRSDDCGSLDR